MNRKSNKNKNGEKKRKKEKNTIKREKKVWGKRKLVKTSGRLESVTVWGGENL